MQKEMAARTSESLPKEMDQAAHTRTTTKRLRMINSIGIDQPRIYVGIVQ